MSHLPAHPLTTTDPHFTRHLAIAPNEPVEQWRLQLPGKGACFLLSDDRQHPLLLSTVGGLRAAVERRLTGHDDRSPSRRIDWRAVVRRIDWRPTFSRFEAHWVYLENARRLMPDQYRRWIRAWRGYWLHVAADEPAARWTCHRQPAGNPHEWFGPLPDSAAARRFIALLEDCFDLCRYHDVLLQAPHGQPCAYKEMGNCPAPCDGSIDMAQYRRQIDRSVDFTAGRSDEWFNDLDQQMRAAAAALDFERAGRIKQRLDRARAADGPAHRHLRPLDRFRFLAVQKGSGKHKHRLFYINPATIHFLGETRPRQINLQIDWILDQVNQLERMSPGPIDEPASERLGLVAWHLMRGRADDGLFMPVEQLNRDRLIEWLD